MRAPNARARSRDRSQHRPCEPGIAAVTTRLLVVDGDDSQSLQGRNTAELLRRSGIVGSANYRYQIAAPGKGRYKVRVDEMRESTKIIAQCVERLEEMQGEPWIADDRKVVLPPREELHTSMESLIHHFNLFRDLRLVRMGESCRIMLFNQIVGDSGYEPGAEQTPNLLGFRLLEVGVDEERRLLRCQLVGHVRSNRRPLGADEEAEHLVLEAREQPHCGVVRDRVDDRANGLAARVRRNRWRAPRAPPMVARHDLLTAVAGPLGHTAHHK